MTTTKNNNAESCPAVPFDPGKIAQEVIRRGIARLQGGDRAGALADFHAAADLAPEWATPWNNAGLVRHMLGQYRAAIAAFDQALARQPDYVDALNNRGRAAKALGEFDVAAADFNRARAGAVGAAAVLVLHNRGMLRQEQGDLAGALSDFDRALELNPRHTATRIARGLARKQAGALGDAVTDFDQALSEQPAHGLAAVYHGRGGVRVLQNKFVEALADYDEALRLAPDNVCYYISRANARYHKRDVRAMVDFRMAFRLDAEGAARELLRILTADAHARWGIGAGKLHQTFADQRPRCAGQRPAGADPAAPGPARRGPPRPGTRLRPAPGLTAALAAPGRIGGRPIATGATREPPGCLLRRICERLSNVWWLSARFVCTDLCLQVTYSGPTLRRSLTR